MEQGKRKADFKEYIERFARNCKISVKVAVEQAICQEVGKCYGLSLEEMQEVAQMIEG